MSQEIEEIDEFSNVVEQQNGEVGRLLDRLVEFGIGRPLYVGKRNSSFSTSEACRLGVESTDNIERVKIGHALPANKEGTAHVIIFESGEMCYISVRNDSPAKLLYSNLFSEETDQLLPEHLLPQENKSAFNLFRQYAVDHNIPVDTYIDGRTPEHYQMVKSYFDQALTIARERKAQIEQTKIKMKGDIVTGLNRLLNTKPPDSPASPPPTPPPS